MARYDDEWPAYVPVAERRRKATREAERLRREGHPVAPVRIEGRAIATTVWGKAWCDNLESYRDYESRLPRGRTYARNGSVIDLQIVPREVKGLVSGSSIYKVTVAIAPVPATQWRSICTDCAGRIDSLVELLQGRLSKGVMERIGRQGSGLFPKPSDIRFSCSCPDFASMCKHVAAVLYGVGARLDRSPELLFRLRAVNENDLLTDLDDALPASKPPGARVLADENAAALFGLDMAGPDSGDGGTGNSLAHRPPNRAPPATAAKLAGSGRLEKKPASAASRSASPADVGRYASMAPRPRTPAASAKRASRPPARRRSSKVAAAPDEVAAHPKAPSARHAAPDRGSGPAPDALTARLDAIAQGLAELPGLRAEVRALGERVEHLAAVMIGQGGGGFGVEAPSPSERGVGPPRARRRGRSSSPASSLESQRATNASGVEDVTRRDNRDQGDAVPPGAALQSPAPLTGNDEAVLHRLEGLAMRRGRGHRGG